MTWQLVAIVTQSIMVGVVVCQTYTSQTEDVERVGKKFSLIGSLTDIQKNAKDYLVQFGYLNSFSQGAVPEELTASITRLQHYANLPMTGKLDAATLHQMTLPRCALPDPRIIIVRPNNTRVRRYVHQGTKWTTKTLLTWKLEGRGRTLNRTIIRKVMKEAFNMWSSVTNIDFEEITGDDPDIWVKFVRYYHQDPYAFDGKGGVLAHAFYPHNNKGLSGDVHFDDDEDFTYKSEKGRNLLWVATHELGHSLGMEHSNVRDAVMYPWYTKYKPGFSLTYDDISGIQALYGSRAVPKTTAPPTTEQATTFTPKTTTATTARKTTIQKKTTTVSTAMESKTTLPKFTTPKTTMVKTTLPKTTTPESTIPRTSTAKATTQMTTLGLTTVPSTRATSKPTTPISKQTRKATLPTTKQTTIQETTTEPPSTLPPEPTSKPPVVPTPLDRLCPAIIKAAYYNWYANVQVLLTADDKISFIRGANSIDIGPAEIYRGPQRRKHYIPTFQVPDVIDAAFSTPYLDPRGAGREYTVVFSGTKYYIFHHFALRSGPHSIHGNESDGKNPLNLRMPSWVKRIDAAMMWFRNGRSYFFSGSYYWRYDNKNKVFDNGYPKKIGFGWGGIPENINAAFSSKKYDVTYFIKGNMLYSIDNFTVRLKSGYPQHVGREWLNCGGKEATSTKPVGQGEVEESGDRVRGPDP